MIESEKVKIRDTFGELKYSSPAGSFSLPNGRSHTCRESFSNSFNKTTNSIIFNKSNINIKKINIFFEQIEDKLQLKEKTKFCSSNFKNAIVIKLSPFWKENSLRRGIFTLFLRCAACHYNGKDVYQSLLNYGLTKKIIGPIEWFIKGNTKPAIKVSGGRVVHELACLNKKEWEESLTK